MKLKIVTSISDQFGRTKCIISGADLLNKVKKHFHTLLDHKTTKLQSERSLLKLILFLVDLAISQLIITEILQMTGGTNNNKLSYYIPQGVKNDQNNI